MVSVSAVIWSFSEISFAVRSVEIRFRAAFSWREENILDCGGKDSLVWSLNPCFLRLFLVRIQRESESFVLMIFEELDSCASWAKSSVLAVQSGPLVMFDSIEVIWQSFKVDIDGMLSPPHEMSIVSQSR